MHEPTAPVKSIIASALTLVMLAACSATPPRPVDPQAASRSGKDRAPAGDDRAREKPRRVDPRKGGFEVALGEWAVTPEAPALRPGKVTFVVTNRGTMPHGFEIELEGDSSGHGSGDLFKAEGPLLQPGETTRLTLDLPTSGVYKIECLVDGHDDMGMEGPLRVTHRAPRVVANQAAAPNAVAIADFSFDPSVIEVPVGTEVTWRNQDPTDHTVTASDGALSSVALGEGDVFTHRFAAPGVFTYRCAIHPEMKGKVKVE